jgi:hypothetical protein
VIRGDKADASIKQLNVIFFERKRERRRQEEREKERKERKKERKERENKTN